MNLRINPTTWAHREAFILRYLRDHPDGAGPTEMGVAFGFDRERASSLFSSVLIALAKEGRVEKTGEGRKARYRLRSEP